MSALAQFRKSGGLMQLLQLVEISDPSRQKSLLHLVASEDPGWAHLIRLKILTIDKILRWPVEPLTQVLLTLPIPLLGNLYIGLSEAQHRCIDPCLTTRQARELKEYLVDKKPDQKEIFAVTIKLIQAIREMESMGLIHLSDFDQTLVLEEKLIA